MDKNAAASARQSPKPRQISKVQQQDSAASSSNVSSEMESDLSDLELMSEEESGGDDEEEEAVEVSDLSKDKDKAVDYIAVAGYNKKGYRLVMKLHWELDLIFLA